MNFSRNMRWAALASAIAVAGCSSGGQGAGTPSSDPPESLRPRWDPGHPDARVDALQVWRLGEDYFEGESSPGIEIFGIPSAEVPDFHGIDLETRDFLHAPRLQSAVQFSCARMLPDRYQASLEAALSARTADLRLQAAAILVRVRDPHSVALQWSALRDLRQDARPEFRDAAARIAGDFSPKNLEELLSRPLPGNRYATDFVIEWAARAAGVTLNQESLPRLVALSRCENLDVSLAAEASLEEFPAPAGDTALVECVLGWKYDAWVRAAGALLRRNRTLLDETLSSHEAPEEAQAQHALFLARCGNPRAVPALCAWLPRRQIVDGEMFDQIERLMKAEHRADIEGLPGRVREDQAERARKVMEAFHAKHGR